MSRVAVVFPGRGSYTAASLGSLDPAHPLVAEVEAVRADYGLVSLVELDGSARFDPRTHLLPANAGPLIYLASLLDAAALPRDAEPVVAVGSAPGWYTALAATGALSVTDGFRLVQEMSLLEQEPPTEGGAAGGQVIYPLVGADWRPDPALARAVDEALASADGSAQRSLDLGGYLVLAGTEEGVEHLMAALPPTHLGERRYPLRLALHGPYQTPLVARVAERARERLASLSWKAPEIALVDGRGARWSPWSTGTDALRDYSLGEQVTTPFDLAASLRVVLREWAPDMLALPGPGTALGSICGQAVVREGYRGIHSRAEFEEHQRRDPLILPMRPMRPMRPVRR
jgi:[acyl-carrier-protein] S-malonyltransferase